MTDLTNVPGEIRTFLIADVRGYTRFTQEHGDEAAARLAARFAEVVREQVEGRGGRVVELRGDEALCVFGSPRAALRAAVDLQRRCAEEMRADASLPLAVGVGIDAGEAVPVADGYRGGALNLASRLCSLAGRGEVLVSDGVVHLARRTDEMRYLDRGLQTLKGFEQPVRVYQIGFDLDLPDEPAPPGRSRRVLLLPVAVAVVLTVIAAVAAGALLSGGSHHPRTLGTNVVGALDPGGHIVGEVHLPGAPAGVAAGAGSLWATVTDLDRVIRIDPTTRAVVDTVNVHPPARAPTGVAVGGGGVWVADSGSGTVSWINPGDPDAQRQIQVGQGPGPIAFGEGAAWVVNTVDATLQRIGENFQAGRAVAVGGSPSAVAVGGGWVWVTDGGSGSLLKIDPRTLQVVSRSHVGNEPVGVAYGGGRVWVANAADGTVTRLDPSTQQGQPVVVGRAPSSVTYAHGAAWVTTAAGVVRVDGSSAAGTTPTHSTPVASTGMPDGLWVAALSSPASHRGGTLRVAYATDDFGPGYGPFDPAVAP